jgi:hypothetical protein
MTMLFSVTENAGDEIGQTDTFQVALGVAESVASGRAKRDEETTTTIVQLLETYETMALCDAENNDNYVSYNVTYLYCYPCFCLPTTKEAYDVISRELCLTCCGDPGR